MIKRFRLGKCLVLFSTGLATINPEALSLIYWNTMNTRLVRLFNSTRIWLFTFQVKISIKIRKGFAFSLF